MPDQPPPRPHRRRAETLAPPGWQDLTPEQLLQLAADGGRIVMRELMGDGAQWPEGWELVISAEARPRR